MYATYENYSDDYFGSIIHPEDWNKYGSRASNFIDYYTRNHAKDHADMQEVILCCCALAEQFVAIDEAEAAVRDAMAQDNPNIASQTVGNYSVTYRSTADAAAAAIRTAADARAQLVVIARQYLANTGLLYRGRWVSCTPLTQ